MTARKRIICDSKHKIEEALSILLESDLIANDIETLPFKRSAKGADPRLFTMTLASFSCLKGDFAFPLQNGYSPAAGIPEHIDLIVRAIELINGSGIPHVGHNFSYDVSWYTRYNLPVKNWAFDTMVMFWSRYPELPKTLAFVASILLDDYKYWKAASKNQPWEYHLHYGMDDTWNTLRLCIKMIPWLLKHEWIRRNFSQAMLRCYASTQMNLIGCHVDDEALKDIEEQLTTDSETALKRLRYMIDDSEFNPNSAPQKKTLLYEILGAKPVNAKGRNVSSIKKASTGAVPMRLIKQSGPIQKRIVEAIESVQTPTKQISNVVKMPHLWLPDDSRLFLTFFDGVGTISTRLASRASAFGHGSNAQNIRKKYRRFIKARPGHFYWDLDFSGADSVFVGFEAEEQNMIDVFVQGLDSHAVTGTALFHQWAYDSIVQGKAEDDPRVTHPITGIRQISKKTSHGCNYLMASYTLLMTATIPTIIAAAREDGHEDAGYWPVPKLVEYCGELESRYRKKYPRLQRSGSNSWYAEIQQQIVDTGKIETIYGFTFPVLGDPKSDDTLRVAAAIFGQANTAGRTNAALYELTNGVRTKRFRDGDAPDFDDPARKVTYESHGVRPVLQVHDSIIFECKLDHPNLREGIESIDHVMNRPFLCKGREFSLGVEGEVNFNWAVKESPADNAADVFNWLESRQS